MRKVVMTRRMPGITILAIALAAFVFSAACGGSTSSSPTASLKAYYAAAVKKDIPGAKRYLSAGTIKVMEEGAKKMGKSLDEALKEEVAQPAATAVPEFSNEKISGDTATVDMKMEGMTVTMPMVKEGGEWKLAMDKMLEDMKKSMGPLPEPPGSVGGGVEAPAGNTNEHSGGHDEK